MLSSVSSTACSICIYPVNVTDVKLECGHMFHAECIEAWVDRFESNRLLGEVPDQRPPCPNCRRPLVFLNDEGVSRRSRGRRNRHNRIILTATRDSREAVRDSGAMCVACFSSTWAAIKMASSAIASKLESSFRETKERADRWMEQRRERSLSERERRREAADALYRRRYRPEETLSETDARTRRRRRIAEETTLARSNPTFSASDDPIESVNAVLMNFMMEVQRRDAAHDTFAEQAQIEEVLRATGGG